MDQPLQQPVTNQDESRDLGFGSVVSRESHLRLLNRDGSFNVQRKGLGFFDSHSVYHDLLAMSWRQFFVIVAAVYLGLNAVFAAAYTLAGPNALSAGPSQPQNPFLRSFFFSVQTIATIGYGHTYPTGLAANVIVTIESLTGLIGFAIITGLIFARFSRPTARILFSKHALVAPYRGIRAFEFRISNARHDQIIELEAKVLLTRFEQADGVRTRRYYYLSLERQKVAFFPLSWTVVHPITAESPLYGETDKSLRATEAEFLVLLTGIDETFSETVHTRSSYSAHEIVWGAKFANIFAPSEREKVTIDLRRLDAVESSDAAAQA